MHNYPLKLFFPLSLLPHISCLLSFIVSVMLALSTLFFYGCLLFTDTFHTSRIFTIFPPADSCGL